MAWPIRSTIPESSCGGSGLLIPDSCRDTAPRLGGSVAASGGTVTRAPAWFAASPAFFSRGGRAVVGLDIPKHPTLLQGSNMGWSLVASMYVTTNQSTPLRQLKEDANTNLKCSRERIELLPSPARSIKSNQAKHVRSVRSQSLSQLSVNCPTRDPNLARNFSGTGASLPWI